MGSILFLLIVIILVLWILASCIRIVPQAYAIVLERLGAYQATWGTGVQLRVCDLEKYNSINLHGYVIFCDNRLWWKIYNLLFQIDFSCHTLYKWKFEVYAGYHKR